MNTGIRLSLASVALLVAAGCATVQEPLRSQMRSDDVAVRDCANWLERADALVREAGVQDAGATRIAGFPYLRSDRFLASFRSELSSPQIKAAWVRALRGTDSEARTAELHNLSADRLQSLAVNSADEAVARAARCGDLLARSVTADETLAARSEVPDDYIDWLRVVGVYPIARLPFGSGVAKWHEEALEMFRRTRAEPARAAGEWRSYTPSAGKRLPRNEVAQLLARGKQHPLGILSLSDAERDALFATYAPVFEVDTTGAWDVPGALKWGAGPAPILDTSRPVVYRRIAYTRYRGAVLPQLVYTMWFTERPLDHSADIYGGALDGLVWRVTLSPQGEPLVYDTMHPCGCFHMFFPTARAEPVPPPEPRDEWAFMPLTLPAIAPDAQIRLRIASRTHYLVDVLVEKPAAKGSAAYAMLDESLLRSLETADGTRRSLYAPDGLVPGTERGERMLFWPMGIASAGTMRQWGRHATAFLGRRHFDDADLFEKRFTLGF